VMCARDSQMEAVSWGKEKPRAQGHDEAAWAQNRRADVVYPAH
jgi:peptidoglycan-associated lipoprotein